MIDRFFYPYDCVISRSTEGQDENGDEIFDIIYDGECGVQVGTNGDVALQGDIYQRSPCLIIPVTDITFMINDKIVATVENNHKLEYTVKSPRIITEEGIEGTTLWLKKGTDV